jgi:hypothetical protein
MNEILAKRLCVSGIWSIATLLAFGAVGCAADAASTTAGSVDEASASTATEWPARTEAERARTEPPAIEVDRAAMSFVFEGKTYPVPKAPPTAAEVAGRKAEVQIAPQGGTASPMLVAWSSNSYSTQFTADALGWGFTTGGPVFIGFWNGSAYTYTVTTAVDTPWPGKGAVGFGATVPCGTVYAYAYDYTTSTWADGFQGQPVTSACVIH